MLATTHQGTLGQAALSLLVGEVSNHQAGQSLEAGSGALGVEGVDGGEETCMQSAV